MKVRFVEPPPALRIGGLESAIRSLEAALRERGVEVSSGANEKPSVGEVFHFHGLWRPEDARLSRSLEKSGTPFLISPHGMLEPWALRHKWWKKWPYFFLTERGHLRRASRLLATAPSEERRLQKLLPGQKTAMLPLGFTGEAKPDYAGARASLGWEPDEMVLLFLSRLHVKKGLELLLGSLSRLQRPARTRLVIVGGGETSYVERVKMIAASMRLPRMDWVGEVWGKDRWRYFQGADLFCLPTYSENFGLAVLEACQVGTPPLTTTETPWAEWLKPDRGIIVEPTVPSVSEGLARFFRQPRTEAAQREGLATWARQQFAWSNLAPRYAALYESLLRGDASDSETVVVGSADV